MVEIGGEKVEEPKEVATEEKNEEALVAALDVKVLHKRVGYLGKVGMERVAREGLVRGLEGGVAGEMEMCEGCELSGPRPHPHRLVDLSHRSTRSLELVHADLALQFECNHEKDRSTCLCWSTNTAGNLG